MSIVMVAAPLAAAPKAASSVALGHRCGLGGGKQREGAKHYVSSAVHGSSRTGLQTQSSSASAAPVAGGWSLQEDQRRPIV
eukprot:4641734-Pyramimonas_sp.AAC.1